MKKIIFLFAALFFVVASKAQDIITLTNGNQVQAKVLEVNPDDIKYKDFNNQDGPTITVRKDGVSMIQYANGSKTVFNDPYNKNVASSSGTFKREPNNNHSRNRDEGNGFRKRSDKNQRLHGWYFGANLNMGESNASTSDASFSTQADGYSGLNISAVRMFNQHLGLQFGLGFESYVYDANFSNGSESYDVSCLNIPVRALYFSNTKHRAGLYVAAGFDLSLTMSVSDQEGEDISSYYSPVLISPYISAGVEFRNKYATTFWMFGLFYKTTLNNVYSGNQLSTDYLQLNSGNTGTLNSAGLSITMMHKYFRDK